MGKSIINIVNRTQNYTNKTKHAAQKTEKISNTAYAINTAQEGSLEGPLQGVCFLCRSEIQDGHHHNT
jgi:hypothetical protein